MMISNQKYLRYLFIKSKIDKKVDGVNYRNIIAHDISRLILDKDKRPNFKEIIYSYIKTQDTSELKSGLMDNKPLILSSIERSDYNEQIKLVLSKLIHLSHIQLSRLPTKYSFEFILTIKTLIYTYRKLYKHQSIYNIIFIAGKLIYYHKIHEKLLLSNRLKVSNIPYLICFNSSYQLENLICQMHNLRGIETYTLSHSLYIKYKNEIPLDIINGENIVANKILVWGNTSKVDLIENFDIDEDRILITGNVKYPFKSIKIKQSFNNCIVLMGRVIYNDSNIEILKIIKKLSLLKNISFDIKLHPSLNYKEYVKSFESKNIHIIHENISLSECFITGKYDFSIVNNSTSYYESMYYNMISFRFGPGENDLFIGLDDKFDDLNSLIFKIDHYRNSDSNMINSLVENCLIENLGLGIDTIKDQFEI